MERGFLRPHGVFRADWRNDASRLADPHFNMTAEA
jgi:hypothetical protein